MEDTVDVRLRISAARQDGSQLLNVGDGPQVGRHLLGTEPAVGIGADAHMTNVPGQLANVVNVVSQVLEAEIEICRLGTVVTPTVNHHDRIHRHTDDCVATDEFANLVVGELPIPVGQSAAVGMTGPNGPGKPIQGIPEGLITQMGDIEDQAQSLHLGQEFTPVSAQGPLIIGAGTAETGAIMGQTHGSQTVGVGPLQMGGSMERIGSLQTEDVSDRLRLGRGALPIGQVGLQAGQVSDEAQFACGLHLAVPRQLALGLGPRLRGAAPARHAAEPVH